MRKGTRQEQASAAWFFEDRAIGHVDDDRLDHQAVAAIVVKAVEAAKPPCMIGLLAEFGKGKTSTTNIAAAKLRESGRFDTATVSADKHSGNARARNIVHAIAAELERYKEINPAAVREILRPLRQATQVAAADPTDTPANRFAEGRYSYKGLGKSLLPFAIIAAVAAIGALLAGAPLKNLLTILAATPILVWVVAMTFAGTDTPMGSMLTPATLTDQKPRAEAADEIEEVFGQLIDYHYDQRNRRLVVFVDDIDRLSKDDLLDALRALRSLQSVPRDREPIFVISGNERIVRSAVSTSADAPAQVVRTTNSHIGDVPDGSDEGDNGDEDHAPEPTPLVAAPPAATESPGSEHDHPALAFIDKLLTIRVPMPPTMRGDMRRFADDLVASDHPLRAESGLDVDRVLAILVHDGVDDPRSVIRLLNGFVTAFLLGREREDSGRVFRGDVTHHPDVLAQLAVIFDEFPDFYDDIARNPILLEAASKVALRQDDLSPSERDALARSSAFVDDPARPGSRAFRRETLRRYLSGTARLVHYPPDVGPLVYFTATPGGRRLGVELRNELLSALRVGDADELAGVLARVPSDRVAVAGEEIADILRQAAPVDAANYLAATAPNLGALDAAAVEAADACADLLDRSPGETPDAHLLTQLLDHVAAGRDTLVCDRLVRHRHDTLATNDGLVHAALYMSTHPRVRAHVEPALLSWLSGLPDEGGWELARPWLDVAEALEAEHLELSERILTAITQMLRTEQGFTGDDADRLVALASRAQSPPVPRAGQLAEPGPNTASAFIRIWDVASHEGGADEALLAANAAKDGALDAGVRKTAVALVTRWAGSWKDETREPAEGEDEEIPVRAEILDALVAAVPDADVLASISAALPSLAAALSDDARDLVDAVVAELESRRDGGLVDEADRLAAHVMDALMKLSAAPVNTVVARLLAPVSAEVDPASPVVQMSCRLIQRIAEFEHGKAALATVADTWADAVRRPGAHDDRSLLEGFRVLDVAATDLVAPRATPIYTQTEQLLQAGDDPAGRLRVLAMFPWPDAQVPGALAHLDAHWDSVPEDARLPALTLATRSADDTDVLSRFRDRMVSAAEREPAGLPAAVAAKALVHMSEQQRSRLFVAAVGHHASVTQSWREADDDEAARTIALHSDADPAHRLLEVLSAERRPVVAQRTLVEITTTDDVPENVIDVIVSSCDTGGRQAALEAALAALPAPNPEAISALRVVIATTRQGAALDDARVDALICEMLPAASEEVATLFGRATRGRRRIGDDAHECVKGLRREGSSIATAFDAAREG